MPLQVSGSCPESGPARGWVGICRVIVSVAVAMFAGCAGPTETSRINMSGFSPAFKQGYADGCESAGARAQRRNASRYKTESDYMMGWNDGYSACRR